MPAVQTEEDSQEVVLDAEVPTLLMDFGSQVCQLLQEYDQPEEGMDLMPFQSDLRDAWRRRGLCSTRPRRSLLFAPIPRRKSKSSKIVSKIFALLPLSIRVYPRPTQARKGGSTLKQTVRNGRTDSVRTGPAASHGKLMVKILPVSRGAKQGFTLRIKLNLAKQGPRRKSGARDSTKFLPLLSPICLSLSGAL